MRYRIMNNTELNLSSVCLGCAGFGDRLSEEDAFLLLDKFTESGGNFIDTANVYCRWIPGLDNCSEKIIGRWLKSRKAYNKVFVATKGAHYDINDKNKTPRLSESDIRSDIEDSLKALGTEAVDFYWLHRDDENRPVEYITDILEMLKKEGKLRYYGFSNFTIKRAEAARLYLKSKGLSGPYAISNQWSLASLNVKGGINPDPTLVMFDSEEYEWHKSTGIPSIPYSAAALGFFDKLGRLGDKMPENIRRAYWNDDNLRKFKMLTRISNETGYSVHALSIAWLTAREFQVFPVCAASSLEQLNDITAAGDISPDVFEDKE